MLFKMLIRDLIKQRDIDDMQERLLASADKHDVGHLFPFSINFASLTNAIQSRNVGVVDVSDIFDDVIEKDSSTCSLLGF